MEKVPGVTAGAAYEQHEFESPTIQATIVSTTRMALKEVWLTDIQTTQVRHGVRVLRAAGINQTDWHKNQIMCVHDDLHGLRIIFIDFAFATMYLGDDGGLPPTEDLDRTADVLAYELDFAYGSVAEHWSPPLEYEY